MNELSLHILDIAQNSVQAKASLIEIIISEDTINNELVITIIDNGVGMSTNELNKVKDPFYTSRVTRKVGLGISLFELSTIQSNGNFIIESVEGKGTKLTAKYEYDNINRVPLGNIVDTIYSLSLNDNVNIIYKHIHNSKQFIFETNKIKEILNGIPFTDYSVMKWIKDYLNDGLKSIKE